MASNGFFLVIEGLDGSGKTEITRRLLAILQQTHSDNVKLTYEPHDPSCAGPFIRQVLAHQLAYTSARTLALAFAANRADHNDREIGPYLDGADHRIVICDRYYLSSLVYQVSADVSIDEVMGLSAHARKPDLTIFLNADDDVCYGRMRQRGEDQQLFEERLGETRRKYRVAIDYARKQGDRIFEVDANHEIPAVLQDVLGILASQGPGWLRTLSA